jgi:hypothetical protein
MAASTTTATAQDTILVEFAPRPGVQQASRLSPQDVAEKSAQALDKAMATIRQMGHRVSETVKSIDLVDRPDKVVLEFGLKLDAEAGALIAKASTEANFKVVLTWEQPDEKHE